MKLLYLLTVFWAFLQLLVHAQETETVEENAGEDGLPDVSAPSNLEGAEQFEFQAEVNRLMEIIIHSLYTDRDIFLRELISNGADALDKIRYQSLTDKSALGSNKNLEIKVKADPEAQTLTIIDTGIGMTADEMAKNLGTVAHSGTAAFLDKFAKASKDGGNALSLIGQFGVGFYSAFLVADEVTVISKSNEDGKQHIWHSLADGKFSVSEDKRGDTLGRGTAIILKLKEDAQNYLQDAELERIIGKYSEFATFPIKIWTKKTETVEQPVEVEAKEKKEGDDDLETTDEDDEADKPKTKTVQKTVWYWKQLNTNKPLWARKSKDINAEEYEEFYKAFTKESDGPLTYSHFSAEGEIEFDSILYVPKKAPYGLYDNYYTQKSALRLYVRRVLVNDKFEDIIPRYLNFIKGLVDSNDLPLNVNREQLQKNKVMKVISRKLTRKALDMLRDLAKEDADDDDDDADADKAAEKGTDKKKKYLDFWKEFGKSIKLGIIEDQKNRKKLMDLLRFTSSKSPEDFISLQTYVDRMKDGQKNIFFASGGSKDEVEKMPMLEKFKKDGIEVLYFVDNLDEYLNLDEFDDYKFQSIAKEGVELGGKKFNEFMQKKEEEYEDLKKWFKDTLGSKVSKVQVSRTLESSPVGVVTTKYGYSAHMERISKAQAFGTGSGMGAQKILEINYRHPVIKEMKKRVADNGDDEALKDYAQLLFDMALVQSGFDIDDTNAFSTRLADLVRNGLGVTETEIDPEPEFAEDSEDEADAEGDDDDADEPDEYDDEVEPEAESESDGDKTEL